MALKMEVKPKHIRIIESKLGTTSNSIQIERLRKFPKRIKFHFHITDGFTERVYYYKVTSRKEEDSVVLYCQLSPIILLLYFNVTFWTEGEKWMQRYKP